MDSHPPESGPSPYSSLPDPCHRCKQTICFLLHSGSASTCPYNLCPECRELKALDAQIMDLQNCLINLSNKRHELKGRINRRHDRFTSRLPIELISEVFALIVHEISDPDPLLRQENNRGLQWNPVLMLGGVCKRWREITLGTSTLWTRISIGPRKDTPFNDFTDQWLSRSGKLPLFLQFRSSVVRDNDENLVEAILPHSNPVQLLKSHANRWKDLTLRGSAVMLPMILTGMEDRLVVDSLLMDMHLDDSDEPDEVTMEYPFVPKRLSIRLIPVRKIPVQWDMLTYLKTEYVSVDGLLHLIRHAHNLQNCFLRYVEADEGHYPIPISPATNYSVEEFHVETLYNHSTIGLLVSHLTFPSLKILHWNRLAHRDDEDLYALNDFLNRSQPQLHHFSFHECYPAYSIAAPGFDWSGILPCITSLQLDINNALKEMVKVYIDSLGAHVEPMAFPRLRDLKIKVCGLNANPDWWSGLAAVFSGSQDATMPMFSRPLKTVTITIDPSLGLKHKIMDRATYSRLRAVQDSGVNIEVLDSKHQRIDILGPDAEPVFSE